MKCEKALPTQKKNATVATMTPRDAAEFNEASETPDMGELDTPDDILAEIIATMMPKATPFQIRQAVRFYNRASRAMSECGVSPPSAIQGNKALNLARSIITTCLFPRPNEIRCMAVSYALDLGLHGNKPMAEMAKTMGISRAALSNEATKIVKINGLTPSRWMRCEEATKASREARERVLTNNTNDHKELSEMTAITLKLDGITKSTPQ